MKSFSIIFRIQNHTFHTFKRNIRELLSVISNNSFLKKVNEDHEKVRRNYL